MTHARGSTDERYGGRAAMVVSLLAVAALTVAAVDTAPAMAAKRGKAAYGKAWKVAAKKLRTAQVLGAKADLNTALARSYAMQDEEERDEFIDEAKEEYSEEKSLARDQYSARLDLADELEEQEIYSVDIDPEDFSSIINNPRLPYLPGTILVYEGETDEGDLERIEVEALDETIEILGVTCRVVRDTVSIEGVLVEDTRDYFAQDSAGNVWYFGEISLNYEDGRLVDVEGSWMAGVDGAQPGIVMFAAPVVGRTYRQEFLLGEAEDYGSVLGLTETAEVEAGTYFNCLKTLDASPIEPDGVEHKFYATGIGMVLEVKPESGERVELVDILTNDE